VGAADKELVEAARDSRTLAGIVRTNRNLEDAGFEARPLTAAVLDTIEARSREIARLSRDENTSELADLVRLLTCVVRSLLSKKEVQDGR